MNQNSTNPTAELQLPEQMSKRLLDAANLIKSIRGQYKVISHYDGDGLSAGAVISATLLRLNKSFHITLQHNLDPNSAIFSELKTQDKSLKIFTDLGSGSLDEIEALGGWSIILDHHASSRDTKKNNVIHINSHMHGINGSFELSAATLAFLLSIQITDTNWDLLPIALAGAMADKQHKNGFKGLNLQLVKLGLEKSIIEEQLGFKLPENNIQYAIVRSTDPYIIGLTNNESGVLKLLNELGINPDDNIRSLDKNLAQKLISILILNLIEQGVPPEDAEEFITRKFYSTYLGLKIELEEFSHVINACGRMRQTGIGVAAGLGDKNAYEVAKDLRATYKQHILDGLHKLEKNGPVEMDHIQYFYEDTAEFAGTFAGIGMMYFFNQEKPVIALTKTEDNIKVSGRGTNRLIRRGLDLAEILSNISKKLNGTGGGHQIAAGATIPKNKDEELLRFVDEEVGKQLKR